VILAVAAALPDVDEQRLEDALERGAARAVLARHTRESRSDSVVCSPHIFQPDGSDHANPGLEVAWQGDWGVGYPLITRDDPTVYDDLIRLAAA
jgi:hypothetical protein